MTLWACFICRSRERCEHREPELVIWIDHLDATRAHRLIALRERDTARRMPPASADRNTRDAHVARPMQLVRKAAG